ncbi:MAG: hypothetical protein KAS72_15205 [Phycisphaerales bacterium]|nr:hypothetical protein [Phycisphaerales bacterium]
MKRGLAIFWRWVDLVGYGVIAACLWVVIAAALPTLLGAVSGFLASFSPSVLVCIICFPVVALSVALGRGRWRGFFGFRHLLTYPPLWVAVVASIAAHWLLVAMSGSPAAPLTSALVLAALAVLACLIAVAVCLTVLDAYGWRIRRPVGRGDSASEKPAGRQSGPVDFNQLTEWLRDDREVEHPDDDRFEHKEVARRIADRLKLSEDEAPTVAVVGPLGSGKSTIKCFVKHYLRENEKRRVEIVDISLWPFDTPEAAVAGILRALVQALSKHVNVLSIAGLSDEYISTIEHVGGRWGAAARLLRSDGRPEAVAERLSRVAAMIDIRFILWIEDLERFAGLHGSGGGARLSGEQAALRDAERLGAIRALLFQLDRCDSVSVVVSDSSLHTRFDVGKIARFVERLPRTKPTEVWRQIAILRTECLNGYPRTIIDPVGPKVRGELVPPEGPDAFAMRLRLHMPTESGSNIQQAVVLLLETPRALKSSLRVVLETWKQLAGEIDFDDVLVASVLREARPDVFALIDENIEVFRDEGWKPLASRTDKTDPNHVQHELDSLVESEPSERLRAAVHAVIAFLFPAISGTSRNARAEERPQGVRRSDYWERYMATPGVSDNESDQAALRAIEAWQAGEDNDLVARVLDNSRAGRIEAFSRQLGRQNMCRLLKEVAHAVRHQPDVTWNAEHYAPGISNIWGICQRRPPPEDVLLATLLELTRELVPIHLPLAWNINWLFAGDRQNNDAPELLNNEEMRVTAWREVVSVLKASFSPDGEDNLFAALRDGYPLVLYYVAWGPKQVHSGRREGEPFEGWAAFSDVLLSLAKKHPNVGVPVIAAFITRGGTRSSMGGTRRMARLLPSIARPQRSMRKRQVGYSTRSDW